MNNTLRFSVLAIFSSFASSPLSAQQKSPLCGELQYENHNMIDYGPLRISAVRGIVKDPLGIVIPHACVGVFSESNHKLVAAERVDSEGLFEIPSIPDGKYRLIVAYDSFCAANVSIILRNRAHGKKRLVATMRPSGIDVCSHVEWR